MSDKERWWIVTGPDGYVQGSARPLPPGPRNLAYREVEVMPVAEAERIREAARSLIGAYMGGKTLADAVNALETACGFQQQGAS